MILILAQGNAITSESPNFLPIHKILLYFPKAPNEQYRVSHSLSSIVPVQLPFASWNRTLHRSLYYVPFIFHPIKEKRRESTCAGPIKSQKQWICAAIRVGGRRTKTRYAVSNPIRKKLHLSAIVRPVREEGQSHGEWIKDHSSISFFFPLVSVAHLSHRFHFTSHLEAGVVSLDHEKRVESTQFLLLTTKSPSIDKKRNRILSISTSKCNLSYPWSIVWFSYTVSS